MTEFIWDGQELATAADIGMAVDEILAFYERTGVDDLAYEFLDDYGVYIEKLAEEEGRECDGRKVARDNIGYMAGYQDDVTKHKIFDLFGCEHPLFGRRDPTPEEAFERGKEWAKGVTRTL